MFKDKILFLFKRCDHNNSKILTSKDFFSLSIISSIVITRSFKFIVENNLNENSFDMKKDVLNKKRLILILRALKEKKIQKSDFINIIEIDALAYYHLVRNKENKFFSLTMNEIYDTFIQLFEI